MRVILCGYKEDGFFLLLLSWLNISLHLLKNTFLTHNYLLENNMTQWESELKEEKRETVILVFW